MLETIASGTAFGAALVASGMYSPYLIASQFTLQKWNMVQTFLSATACSACVPPKPFVVTPSPPHSPMSIHNR